MAEKRYIGTQSLGRFLEKLKGLFASKDDLPTPPGDPLLYWNGQGEWTTPRGTGDAAGFGTITASIVDDDSPSVDASWDGPNDAKNLTFTFKGIKGSAGRDGKIESVTVTSDNTHSESPTAQVTMGGEPGAQTVDIAFTGLQGAPGKDGAAAAIGTINATIDGEEGEPSVDVKTEGENESKNVFINFHNLKGKQGEPGKDATIDDVTVTVDQTPLEQPTATAQVEGSNVSFDFKGLKGNPGDKGEPGANAGFGTITVEVDRGSDGEPSAEANWSGLDTAKDLTISFHNLKGETGPAGPSGTPGDKGDTGGYYEPKIEGDTLTFEGKNGAPKLEGSWQVKGETGPAGQDAKIETVTVTVDSDHSEAPTATATVEGTTVNFDFKGLAGAPGKDGQAGADSGFGTITATIDGDAEGEQSVDASWDGDNTSKNLTLAFHNLKGETGPAGEAGKPGEAGPKGDKGGYYKPTITEEGQLSFTAMDGAEELEGTWQVKGADGQTGPAGKDAGIESVTVKVDSQHLDEPTATAEVSGDPGAQTIAFDFKGLVGATGEAGTPGAKGDTGGYYKPSVTPEGQLSFSAENGADPLSETFDIKGPKGDDGNPGIDAKIETITVKVDGEHSDVPTATATVDGDAGAQTVTFDFKGLAGAKGENGAKGDTGGYYKPSVSEEGELSFTAMNGAEDVSEKWTVKGADGQPGAKGETGGYYEPSIDDGGTLTFTEKNGAPHIDLSVKVKGEDGAKGDDGAPGKDGVNAKISAVNITVDDQHLEEPTATASVSGDAGDQTLTLDFKGLVGATGPQGAPGKDGADGDNGIDAQISRVTVSADNTHLESPTAIATMSGTPGDQTLDIKFTGLMGATGAAGKDFKPGGTDSQVTLGDGTTKDISELANDEGFVTALLANETFVTGLIAKLPFLEVTAAS